MTADPSRHHNTNATSLSGNLKATRADWLHAAMQALVAQGVEGVIQALSARLTVSRSSFYWYFKSREHLFDALLDQWHGHNTKALIRMAEKPAVTITEAVDNLFSVRSGSRSFRHTSRFRDQGLGAARARGAQETTRL